MKCILYKIYGIHTGFYSFTPQCFISNPFLGHHRDRQAERRSKEPVWTCWWLFIMIWCRRPASFGSDVWQMSAVCLWKAEYLQWCGYQDWSFAIWLPSYLSHITHLPVSLNQRPWRQHTHTHTTHAPHSSQRPLSGGHRHLGLDVSLTGTCAFMTSTLSFLVSSFLKWGKAFGFLSSSGVLLPACWCLVLASNFSCVIGVSV